MERRRLAAAAVVLGVWGTVINGRQSPVAWPEVWVVTTAPPLPEPMSNNAVASGTIGNRPLVFTVLGIGPGRDWRAIHQRAYQFDINRGTWERLPDVPGRAGRLAATAQVWGDRVYVFGGYEVAGDGAETSAPATDIYEVAARRWTRGADIPTAVDDSVSGVWRGRLIYLVGGWSKSDNVSLVQIYDPARDIWQPATSIIGTPVFGHSGAIVNDTIVYCGGARVQTPKVPKYVPADECYRGDIDPDRPAQIAWRRIAAHPGPPRYRAAAGPVEIGQLAGVLFVGGTANPFNYDGIGYDGQPSEPLASSWIYDIGADRWMDGPRLTGPTMDHRGVVRAGGAWFVVGGFAAGQTVTTAVSRLIPRQ